MKIKEYFNSLVSRRKSSTTTSKCDKLKSHHKSLPSADCNYEICGYDDQHSRTQILLNRHAQLVNTIVGIRSQQEPLCSNYRIPTHQLDQENCVFNRNYSSTLATCNPRRESEHQTCISTSNNSLATKTRQRSKIRTNPWIKTTRISQPEYSIYDPTISSGLIHSESFPQTISNGNIHSINPSNIILHQSDSGQGVSLSSSRNINSSSPDNTSSDGPLLDEKYRRLRTKHNEQSYPLKLNSPDTKRRIKNRYQRPSNTHISSPKKSSINRSTSPRVYDDHFSTEFEDIVENQRLHKQRSPTRESPFILPLDETDVKSPSTISYSTTLNKTNSNTILQHIEEIENEIRMIKNLNISPDDEQILSSNIYSNEDKKQSIHEQVDQWIEQCLTIPKTNPTTLLHNQCNHLSNTIKDYLLCVYSNDNYKTSSLPKPQKKSEIMTAFYLTSIPTTKQTFSLNNQILQLNKSPTTATNDFKLVHECPF